MMAENNENKIDVPEEADVPETKEPTEENVGDGEEKASKADKKKTKKLEEELQKKETELSEANDKYTRLFAEYENFRKRTAKEKEGIYADAYLDALSQILPVLDNLERAAAFENADAESLKKGLELTLKSFADTLDKMGVKEIEALGKTFDPNLHNAVMHIDDESFGEGEIVEVFAKGYQRGDKVLRYSVVKVAN
ncbi:MAG: nucleotide exchange factor GrpE [Clostridia bacterium]|nr:nucleotide exchange factor GrpE [Clostridia bacterium]MBR2389146.1 nucleotide exchange factor GrpE [Clostridia bacterium]